MNTDTDERPYNIERSELRRRLRDSGQRNGELQGRVASLQGESDHYKAHADKLAEALRRAMQWLSSYPGNGAEKPYEQAREALAAYEQGKEIEDGR